ncbi:ABC-three component system middle component 1 [Acinetobacter haemolyticus]|uniref:ABC-three component system middle component 1 n=1 Tax=Acinetobacter haemolyticus TaxID=29430 RepID=UPI003C155D54
MIKDFIHEALKSHDFIEIETKDNITFFKKENNDYQRYVIIFNTTSLENASTINNLIIENTPEDFINSPSFNKNTDLIITLALPTLSDFKINESKILEIEENVYQFKKYILYYSEGESELLNDKNFKDLQNTLSNHNAFKEYKNSPLSPSLYSLAARIFIKLPFLEMPIQNEEILPIEMQIENLVKEKNLEILYNTLNSYNSVSANENLIKELIDEEFKNFQA